MFHPLSWYVGLRYMGAKRRNHFISFIALVSMAGIALGVATLITVISVMNGFERELKTRILGMISHANVTPWSGDLDDWRSVVETATATDEVVAAAPFIEQETMLRSDRVNGALVRGVIPELEARVSELGDKMVAGSLDDLAAGEYRVILGVGLAARLGVGPGDGVTIFAPQVRSSPAGIIPQVRRFEVTGLFEAGVDQYDTSFAIIHMEDAQKLFRRAGAEGVRLKVEDLFRAWTVAREVADRLGGVYQVRDWSQQNANYFRAVQMEKTVMFVILSLIIAVAVFNIVATLVMVVTDKQSDIAIFKTMGATPATVMRVFIVQGLIIGIVGTLLGVLGGIALALNVEQLVAWLEQLFNTEFLSAEVYYISDLPSELRAGDVIKFSVLALGLSLLSTLYPAWRAARTQPAEALRYE